METQQYIIQLRILESSRDCGAHTDVYVTSNHMNVKL